MELKVRTKKAITSPEQIAKIFCTIQKAENEIDKMKEKLWVVGLDTRKHIVYVELVALGTLNACLVHPREVFRLAVVRGVANILAVHGHPSGDPEPSEDDITITRRLFDAGQILGIELVDHVIITDGPEFVSLRAKSKL